MTDERRYWPQLLQQVADVAGEAAALKLVQELGGQKITVPLRPEASILAAKFGIETARVLVDHYGGNSAYIPNLGLRLAAMRKKFVLTHPHMSANHLAASLGISSRQVEKIRALSRPDHRQPNLFDA